MFLIQKLDGDDDKISRSHTQTYVYILFFYS